MRTDAALRASQLALVSLASAGAFLLLNPFLALLLVALLAMGFRVPALAIILPASVGLTLFFYFRQYGVDWYPGGATDDVPQYIALYESDFGLSFADLFTRFIDQPNGYEPLWHLPIWALQNGLNATSDTFIFLHYLVIFVTLFCALATFSRRYLPVLAIVYFFLIPISLDSIAFIWRQQFAFSLFLMGIGLYLIHGMRVGRWILFLTPFVHVSCLFFLAIFLLFEFLNRRRAFENKPLVSVLLAAVLLVIPIGSSLIIQALDRIGLGRIMTYVLQSAGQDVVRTYLLMGVYAFPQVAAFYLLKSDAVNRLILVMCLAVFSIVLSLPAANGVYDRLLMFTLPLISLYLFRCLMLNFSVAWRLPVLLFVFFIGVFRVYGAASEGYGPGAYLAYGGAFDPAMGIIKMLSTL